jgi:Domain of unknown function (DUF4832)
MSYRIVSPRLLLAAAMVLAFAGHGWTASGAWIGQTYVHGPADNPLKGFMPYQGSYSAFPHSMEWNYIAWKDVQTGPTTFNWAPIDTLLNDVASRGHQTVFRIYADYPTLPYGVPGFLSGVAKNAYTDYGNTTSFSPNYDDPAMVSAMVNLIGALGARYDGDARVGFITVGLIGFWGEWHTYRDSCACDTWMPTAATQSTVLSAFDNAFNRTKILLRKPTANSASLGIGYHDDSFNYSTYGATAWYFWPGVIAAGLQNKWQTEPIGGELYPPLQLTVWDSAGLCVTGGAADQQCFNTSVDTTHASWMIAHALFSPGNSGAAHTAAVTGAERLGYDLFAASVALPDTTTTSALTVSVRLQNRGVAPFYYNWPVQIAAANASNQIVATWTTSWDLRTAVTSADRQLDFSVASHGLTAGTYKLLMRAVQPLANGKPLRFANQKWGQDVANWLTLDTVTVSAPRATPTATFTATPTPTRTPTATATATTGARATATATATTGGTTTAVNLSSAFNVNAAYSDGTTFSATGGVDGVGSAYSSTLLGTSLTWSGTTFNLGPANQLNGVRNATITVPAGQYATLLLLGTGVNGDQASQTVRVNYTDGTSSTFTQTFSNWLNASQNVAGQSIALTTAYRNKSTGVKDNRAFNLYGYSFALTSTRTVSSLVLPATNNVSILAATLRAGAAAMLTSTATPTSGATATPTTAVGICAGVSSFATCTAYPTGSKAVFNNTLYHTIANVPATRDCPPSSPFDPSSDNWWVNDGGC